MSERTQTAKVILAVQAALRENQPSRQQPIEPGSFEILRTLRSESRPIGEVTKGTTSVNEWTAMSTLQKLAESGLVEVDEDAGTVALTDTGRAAIAG